jgi:hypothetical protein
MRIDQLVLELEDKSEQVRVWKDLPQDSRTQVTRIYARLCVRAAKVVISITSAPTEETDGTPCKLKR